jgi:GGDEF domain-containing protein
VSIGIVQQPLHGTELKDLLQAADQAMYAAKARGGGIELAAGISRDASGSTGG